MLKIEVKGIKNSEGKDGNEVSIEAMGSLGEVIAEFCSVVGSFKKRLAKIDESQGISAEFIFKATMMAELMDIDKDFAMKSINEILKKDKESKEGKKDAPVDK